MSRRVMLAAGTAMLVVACATRQRAPLQLARPPVVTTTTGVMEPMVTNATHRPPPLPSPGVLSQPKSRHVGVPVQLALTQRANPPDNPQSAAKVALGARLFFEPRLSADGTVACASCHDPARAFTDGKVSSVGVGGRIGQRNSPTIMNALYNATQFWDGRAETLEQQAALPIVNPVEMGQPTLEAAVAAIAGDDDYRKAFRVAFGRDPNGADLTRALASYERTQTAYDTPFDYFIAGDPSAIGDDAKRGWQLFNGRAQCNKCHAQSSKAPDPTNFVDDDFHNIGVLIVRHDVVGLARKAEALVAAGDATAVDRAAIQSEMSVLGRFLVTKEQKDIASFKTPDIRNVMVTAPYFHDGSHRTLWDVMDHYNKGDGIRNPWLDEDIQPLALAENEIDDVIAFMASLTTPEYAPLGRVELARQREEARMSRPQRDTKRAFGPKPVQPKPPAP